MTLTFFICLTACDNENDISDFNDMKSLYEKGVVNDYISKEIKVEKASLDINKRFRDISSKLIQTLDNDFIIDIDKAVVTSFEVSKEEFLSIPIIPENKTNSNIVYYQSLTHDLSLILEVEEVNETKTLHIYNDNFQLIKIIEQDGTEVIAKNVVLADGLKDWVDCVGDNWKKAFKDMTGDSWYVGVFCMVVAVHCVVGFTAVFAIGCAI